MATIARPLAEVEEELRLTDQLLEERQRVLDAIPPCPNHGSGCVPHALEWIENAKGDTMPKQIAKKKPRNRAAQDATLINIRAAKRQIAILALAIARLEARVAVIEHLEARVFALEHNKIWDPSQ